MKTLILVFALAQGADVTTTAVGLHRGCIETNPLYGQRPDIGWIVASKSLSTLLVSGIAWKAHKTRHSRVARILMWTGIGVGGGAATWNMHQLPACHLQ